MLKLAEDLSLPIDTVTQSIAILARRGAGKTYTGSVLAEEVINAGVPVVILDPTGAWWGLRSSADGETAGLPVTIFGGDHGDIALEPTAGALIAEVVLEHPGAYILDFSAFTSKTAEQTFAASFIEHLYRGKKPDTGPLLVIVDEADMFAPQRPGPEQTKSLGALESVVRRGRIKGLGCLLITQRAAVLNKNVLTQTEILIIMQTTGPQDREAIGAWIEGNAQDSSETKNVLGSLASLERGQAWVWSPSFLRNLYLVQVRQRQTFDSSNTPGAGQTVITPTKFAQVDLDKLGERIAATIEKQAENDPRRLKAEVQRLKRLLEEQHAAQAPVEVPVLPPDFMEKVPQVAELMRDYGQKILDAIHQTRKPSLALDPVEHPRVALEIRRARNDTTPRVTKPAPGYDFIPEGKVPVREHRQQLEDSHGPVGSAPIPGDAPTLGKAERAFLSALAQYPQGLSRTRLALMTGYSESSGHSKNTLGRLRTLEYINRGEPVQITELGRAALGFFEPLPEPGQPLVDYWMGRLDKAQRALLEVFVRVYPMSTTKEALGNETGYSPESGHFKNTLGRLRGLGLVDGWRASTELMG